jgi:hypothetical protein
MSTPTVETRLKVRCPDCGRVMRSATSRKRGVCSICEPRGNIEKVWSRRMKVKDELLASYMNEKLHKVPTTLDKLKQLANQRVELREVPEFMDFLMLKPLTNEFVAFLKKKVPLK